MPEFDLTEAVEELWPEEPPEEPVVETILTPVLPEPEPTKQLALLVPSRGRPHNVVRLLDAMDATCRAQTRLIVGVDDDDPTLPGYQALADRCEVVVGRAARYRGQLVRWLNDLALWNAQDYPFLGHIGDDNVPHTEGWDVRVIESLTKQGTGFCFADDLDPGRTPGSLSIHIFMTADVPLQLGYFGPPPIQHMYVDPVWYAWGTRTSIEFLSDVVIEHRHYSVSDAPMDESYHHSTGLIPADCERYNEYCDDPAGMNADIVRLGGRAFSAEELAEFNHLLNIPKRWGQQA